MSRVVSRVAFDTFYIPPTLNEFIMTFTPYVLGVVWLEHLRADIFR